MKSKNRHMADKKRIGSWTDLERIFRKKWTNEGFKKGYGKGRKERIKPKPFYKSRTILVMTIAVEIMTVLEARLHLVFPEGTGVPVLIIGTLVAGISAYLRLTTSTGIKVPGDRWTDGGRYYGNRFSSRDDFQYGRDKL